MNDNPADIFQELIARFAPYRHLGAPPHEHVRLWGEGSRGVWLDDKWGPPVGYGPVDHGNGSRNYGYGRVKGDLAAIDRIPETEGWPELKTFLEIVNADESPIESVGCDKHYHPAPADSLPGSTTILDSYIDVMFSETGLNDQPDNLLFLASRLVQAVAGCEKWWGDVSFVLERFKFIPGTSAPWGLMLVVKNYGRGEGECRKYWGESLTRIGNAIAKLPRDFRIAAAGSRQTR